MLRTYYQAYRRKMRDHNILIKDLAEFMDRNYTTISNQVNGFSTLQSDTVLAIEELIKTKSQSKTTEQTESNGND
jgi:plasmid maintenance system antidote protein VapI